MNRYIAILIAALTSAEMQAFQLAPRLVVNITIDQLRSDYIEAFSPLFNQDGFRKLMQEGKVYETATYPYKPVTEASAIATIATGATPYYHGIVSQQWLDKSTLRQIYCVDDNRYGASPANLKTSTVSDEMKISSAGSSIVYSIAADKSSAILSAGHAADNAIWFDVTKRKWQTSPYYGASPRWLNNEIYSHDINNDDIATKAGEIVSKTSMGTDNITDMLSITLSAASSDDASGNWQNRMQSVYTKLDNTLSNLVKSIEKSIGKEHVIFVITSTGAETDDDNNYALYRIPTGTFYINRTANLLNVYISAIYGQGNYVDAVFGNQIFLNHKLIEQKRLSLREVENRCKEIIAQSAGVSNVYTSEQLLAGGNEDMKKIRNAFCPSVSGDIVIDVTPGWKLLNENTQETYISRTAVIPFPIIIYGMGIKAERITTPVTVDRIAPTIAKSIRIRAPNACESSPLF